MNKSQLLGVVSACVFTLITTSTNAEFIENDSLTLTGVSLELISPLGTTELLSLNGSAEIEVTFPVDEGSADDGDNDGLDEVPTEIVALNLTGNSSQGAIVIALNPLSPSVGKLEEQVNILDNWLDVPPFTGSGFPVDSFFDVFVEITIGGAEYHNAVPARIFSTWSNKPPTHNEFVAMFTNFERVALFDEDRNDTGFLLGPGQVIPIPAALWLFGSGLLGLVGIARRKKAA